MLFAARDLSCALRLCSDRGHPGGQESGERSECHELNRLGSPQRRRSPAVPEIGDDSWPERLPTFTRRSAMSSSWPGPRPYLRRVGDVHWRRASYEERRRPLLVHARIGKRCSYRRCSAENGSEVRWRPGVVGGFGNNGSVRRSFAFARAGRARYSRDGPSSSDLLELEAASTGGDGCHPSCNESRVGVTRGERGFRRGPLPPRRSRPWDPRSER